MQPSAGLIVSSNTLYGTAPDGGTSGQGTVFKVNIDGTGFSTLHSFMGGSDGYRPMGGLVVSSNILYGTTPAGGSLGNGTVFRVGTDGTGFTILHNFPDGASSSSGVYTNSDGAFPNAELILAGNTLYGTTEGGGSGGGGTVFAVSTEGSAFTVLYSFTGGSDGASPRAGLICSGNMLYGTTQSGGTLGSGTVFAINTNGTSFTNLHSLNGASEGANPTAGLIMFGNTLYGTDDGAIFKLGTDGTGFMALYAGVHPNRLALSGNMLYGTTEFGGNSGDGTVFAAKADGTALVTLYSFTGGNDGALPEAGLILLGRTLYGTAAYGGGARWGTVFSIGLLPQLTITPSGSNGYTLEFTTNLVSPVWTHVSSTPSIVNGQNTVTNALSGAQQFFRLSQ
jgi:uncharacterized repeat protein (TIGR03803 family)